MNPAIFNPFNPINFQSEICFLSGENLSESNKIEVPVFPNWLMERYQLQDNTLSMLGGNRMKYSEMLLPASPAVAAAIADLDSITERAFCAGYDALMALPELTLFQWMARIMYGTLYQDFTYTIERHAARNLDFDLSPLMKKKLQNLHLMLQSLMRPIEFEDFKPWSIVRFPVNYSKDIFNYKDETHKLNFSLGMNGFGFMACLQDNGEVARFNQEILGKIGHHVLHPAQFEELYGRFMYSNYLLRETEDYSIKQKDECLVLSLPEGADSKIKEPKYATWEDKIFSQVLANMWQPWGIEMRHIYVPPNAPISFLIDEFTYEFIPAEKVNLPS